MPLKVKDLAKELGVASDVLIEALHKLYIDADDESASVNDKIADLVRLKMGVKKKPVKKAKVEPVSKTDKASKATKKKSVKEAPPAKDAGTAKKKAGTRGKKEKEAEVKIPEPPAASAKAEEKAAPAKSIPKSFDAPIIVKRAEPAPEKKPEAIKADKIVMPPKQLESEIAKDDRTILKHKVFIKGKKPFSHSGGFRPKPFARKGTRPFIIEKEAPSVAHDDIKPFIGTDFKKMELQFPVTIRAVAVKVNKRPNDLLQYLFKKGIMVNINQNLDEEMARDLLKDLGFELEMSKSIEEDLMAEHRDAEQEKDTEKRAPIVTIMGHVDHGKTSLLDYIRKTMVAKKEKGGITQHIGAYRVEAAKGAVTFLDTPGHAAFTSMRARGANVTDVVVLVVAAEDGVMPQTREAIDHARAANVPIVVAITKCDLPNANPNKVRISLQKEGLVAEEFGGKTVMVEVSAKTGQGVDGLIDMLMLESELLELKANSEIRARGVVVESKKSAERGVVATLLVRNGTLKLGDVVISGVNYGKVKAMFNDRGESIEKAMPSTPVAIIGLQGVPEVGDEFYVVKDEKKARTLSSLKQNESRKSKMSSGSRITLEDFHAKMMTGGIKELKIVLKADVQGSLEAITHSFDTLSTEEVKVNFVHTMVGDVNESDIMLAVVSNAIIIGFNVKVESQADDVARREGVDVRTYDIIYNAIDDVKAALEGLLEPIEQEVSQGFARIQEVFSSKKGNAAGCMVTKGVINRKNKIRVKRNKEVIFEGELSNLRRFKDDVRDVKEGLECGMMFHNFNDIKAGDIIEAYVIQKIARRLDKK